MNARTEVRVAVKSPDGVVPPSLRIALLPRAMENVGSPLRDVRGTPEFDHLQAPVQIVEGYEYIYEWEGLPENASGLVTDPQEVFQADSKDGRRGRLRPGLSTGTMQVLLRLGELSLGTLELEVRSRKLNYESEYRWMLRDIADQMTELVMNRFAVSATSFELEPTRDAVTLYQRFAFLQQLFSSETFQIALNAILRKPHVAWEERLELLRIGQGIRADSFTVRQLGRAGARVGWANGPLKSIPLRLERRRTEATHDTTPNRFVRFALERWRQVVVDIGRQLAACGATAVTRRGQREISVMLEELDSVLQKDLIREVGQLSRFPADDQVLQRREGYRDVFKAYLEFELAARLSWRGAESSFSAGKRDVATLYEYWAFLQLANVMAKLIGESFDLRPLIELRSDGLNVILQTGKETVLSGCVERHGRKLIVQLCFNRTFARSRSGEGSWTKSMRPDYSVTIGPSPDEVAAFEPITLHFDAKYRVDTITDLFGQNDVVADSQLPSSAKATVRLEPLRDDLLKMHAYRDAIRRSAGAYVVYPGEPHPNELKFSQYHELLPGLGAFALRPSELGEAGGISALKTFVEDVLVHVATRLTQHERGRYWLGEIYHTYHVNKSNAPIDEAKHPGATTLVLLGYVKSEAHWNWVKNRKTYNVRTQDRRGGVHGTAQLLYSQLLLLYCPEIARMQLARIVSEPEFVSKTAMTAAGYPDASSSYWCVQFVSIVNTGHTEGLTIDRIEQLVQRKGMLRGQPTAIQWMDLCEI